MVNPVNVPLNQSNESLVVKPTDLLHTETCHRSTQTRRAVSTDAKSSQRGSVDGHR